MDDLLKVIKTIALETMLQLDSDFIEFGSIKTSNIENGDKLILLRQQGGQRFLCLDVIKKDGD